MVRLRALAALALFVTAALAGGAAVRVGTLAGQRRPAVALLVVAALVVATAAAAARSRRWLATPYW